MIKFEHLDIVGWEPAIRGMRNAMNSWDKSDSYFTDDCGRISCENCIHWHDGCTDTAPLNFVIGPNDHKLMMKLRKAGTDHRKYMRMIVMYVDIIAPLYWWKEFDTYKVGTVSNSCSTMHKIHDKEFTLDDFSCERLIGLAKANLKSTINTLNIARNTYIYGGEMLDDNGDIVVVKPKDNTCWYQMIQLLPSSYNQRRTIEMNYEVLANMYKSRRHHKLDEWHKLCDWIETLPYSEFITGMEVNDGKINA